MKKIYESPKAEVVCYSTPDITSVNTLSVAAPGTPQVFTGIEPGKGKGVITYGGLHS